MISALALPAPVDPDDEWAIVVSMATHGQDERSNASDYDWRVIEAMVGVESPQDNSFNRIATS